jgi:hypothetical protein
MQPPSANLAEDMSNQRTKCGESRSHRLGFFVVLFDDTRRAVAIQFHLRPN